MGAKNKSVAVLILFSVVREHTVNLLTVFFSSVLTKFYCLNDTYFLQCSLQMRPPEDAVYCLRNGLSVHWNVCSLKNPTMH